MPKGVMKLKLGACKGMPKRKAFAWLSEIARGVNRAQNAMQWYWMQWRRDHPDWEPEQRTDRQGNRKVGRDGKPLLEHPSCSQQLAREMYAFGRDSAPRVNSNIISQAWTALLSDLKDNVPYHHEGTARYVWQALLRFERSLATFRAHRIPIPAKDATLYYEAQSARPLSPGIMQRIERYGRNNAVVRLPLWSRQAGHQNIDLIARVDIGRMSRGQRRLLRQIAGREIKMSDSELVERDGRWYLHLVYEAPTRALSLDTERTATLRLAPAGSDHALELFLPGGEVRRVGDDRPLAAEFKRITIHRKSLRYRSRHGHGRGHGKARFYDRLRPKSRRFLDMQDEHRNHLVQDVMRLCKRHDCGRILYREPTKPLRTNSWYADEGLPFNWDRLRADLEYRWVQIHVQQLDVERMGMQEWKGGADDASA